MELVKNRERMDAIRKQAETLVDQMTDEEMIYQTVNSAPPIERLGIKGYDWWNESLHGVARAGTATVFPQAIGLAAIFDEDYMEKVADAISTEARAKYNMQQKYNDVTRYKGLTMWAPNINIFRDPRWGRGHETYGEDPYLTTRLGVRFVEGLQGHDEKYLKVAACAKHFAVHSGPEGLRHEFDARVNKKDMEETYLPAFEACVKEAGVEAVMGAYNRTNGEPCCGSKTLLIDILRDKWGFKGHVVSDCFAVRDFHLHHCVTSTPEESAALAMNNGCDLNCGKMFLYLQSALDKGMISRERLKEAVTNIFATRIKLGNVENKDNPYDAIPYAVVDSKKMQELNLETSEKSMVLLKNANHTLPLDLKKIHTIGIIGPNSNSRRALVGNYEGTASRYYTVTEGIQNYIEKIGHAEDVTVRVSEGCHLYKEGFKTNRESEVREICSSSDVVIACMGLDAGIEGEQGDAGNDYASGDKLSLSLAGEQQQILEAAYECARKRGVPVILLLLSGSALSVTWAQEHVDAIMQCWYPGAQGGRAIADLLFGEKSPEGRLPVTFYKTTEELPDFTDYSMKNRTYRYLEQEALYPFGYGLSYTRLNYSDMEIEWMRDGLHISIQVENAGNYEINESVQVYVKACIEKNRIMKSSEDNQTTESAKVAESAETDFEKMGDIPHYQLRAFCKVNLKPGEQKKVTFVLGKKDFELVSEDGSRYVYDGLYNVYAGGSQPDARSAALLGRVPLKKVLVDVKEHTEDHTVEHTEEHMEDLV